MSIHELWAWIKRKLNFENNCYSCKVKKNECQGWKKENEWQMPHLNKTNVELEKRLSRLNKTNIEVEKRMLWLNEWIWKNVGRI